MSAKTENGGAGPASQDSKERARARDALSRFHDEGQLDQSYDAKNLVRLWPFVKPHSGGLVASILLLLVSAALKVTRPLIMGKALDGLLTTGDTVAFTRMGLVFAGLLILDQLIAFPQMYFMQLAGARSMADLRLHVFKFLHTRRLGFFDRTPVGRLVTRVTNDIDAINEMFASGALNAIGDLVTLLAIIVSMLKMNPRMALVAFAAVPPVAVGVNWTRHRIRDAYREIRAKTARMNAYLNEQVSGMTVVQAYAREERAAAEFDEINLGYRDANNRSIVYESTLDAAIEMISSVCIALILWYAGWQAGQHLDVGAIGAPITFGTLVVFVDYVDKFFIPIRDLSARYTLVQSAMTGAERVFQLLDNDEEDSPLKLDGADGDPSVAFELDHVTFEYKPGAPVLRDVSISARKGEKIALVGATGAGKSTIASVLLRLYDAKEGHVRVFGKDVTTTPRADLRRNFAVVPQDVFLFPGSVATNIAAGDAVPDRDRVIRALTRIGALDLFERREGGLDAPVLERGNNFSAGERQLIAFARALYRDPPILILDEATANVDSATEARLQRALDGAMKGRTALIIAHRLSTIRAVDRIVVFHKGRVIEQGTHEALLAAGGFYARLHNIQFAREAAKRGERTSAPMPAQV